MVYNDKSERCRNMRNHSRGFDMDNTISSALRVCSWERFLHIFGWMGIFLLHCDVTYKTLSHW